MFYFPKIFKTLDSYWLYRSIMAKLSSLKRDGRLDIVDAHFGYPDGVGSVRAAKELDVPVTITVRGVEEDYLQVPAIAKQIRAALKTADGCICVSHSLKRLAIEAGATEARTQVIHNAVNRNVFSPGDRSAARAILGVGDHEALIVSVGNLLSVKCHEVLIAAFSRLHSTVENSRLVIVGGSTHEPEYPLQLTRLCERLGVTGRVTFTGKIDESTVATWLRAADLFALASRREGCCNAVLEALASGLPVVTTPVGDNGWFVQEGVNGYLVPVGDSEAMAGALGEALNRRNWDKHRISTDLQVGDWDSVAAKVVGFLGERIEEHAGSPLKRNQAKGNGVKK